MNKLLRFFLGLIITLIGIAQLPAAETNAASARIRTLEVQIRSGTEMKEMRSHLYLLISRHRPEAPGATDGRVEPLHTKGYNGPDDKWGPNEVKTFGPFPAAEHFNKEDLGGIALINTMDVPTAAEFEVEWIRIFGIDESGKKWLIAKAAHRWLRNKPETHELQVLPIPTGQWTEVSAGQ